MFQPALPGDPLDEEGDLLWEEPEPPLMEPPGEEAEEDDGYDSDRVWEMPPNHELLDARNHGLFVFADDLI
jgi:hypothetical protein